MEIIDPRDVAKEARKRGMTLQELSARINVPFASLRRWSRGEDSPKVEAWKEASRRIKKLKAKAGSAPTRGKRPAESKRSLTASEILRLPEAEQDRILRAAARRAAPLYESGQIEILEAFGEDDLFDETP